MATTELTPAVSLLQDEITRLSSMLAQHDVDLDRTRDRLAQLQSNRESIAKAIDSCELALAQLTT